MTLQELLNKTCLIGLTYFDTDGQVLKQSQLCGRVTKVDVEMGISVALFSADNEDSSDQGSTAISSEVPASEVSPSESSASESADPAGDQPAVFILPAELSPWFVAPLGRYRDPETGVSITDPDFLVTWDIHQTREKTEDGQHQWWQWYPRTVPPQVGG